MFDNLFQEDQQQSGVDALLKLLDSEDMDLITNLEMSQIKVLVINKWFYYLKLFPDKPAVEIMNMTLEYYKKIKPSYKNNRSEQIVKGVSEMKEALYQAGLIQKQEGMQ